MSVHQSVEGLTQRQLRGALGHQAGLAAEDQVERYYVRRGHLLLQRRWRGRGGEIDLIFRNGAEVIFVEVKASASHAAALARVSPRQLQRLMQSAEAFLGTQPDGLLTPMRLDVAMVDAGGQIDILQNAIMT